MKNVAVLIFDEVEVLDFCGPFEVFATAALPPESEGGEETRLYEVFIIAEDRELVRCRGGLLVQPHYSVADHPPLDIIVVPGGYGTRQAQERPAVLDWIRRQRASEALTTSVCTGAFLLGAVGLLDGKKATTHWSTIDELRETYSTADVRDDARFIDEGEIITAAGVSAGIDMALHVVRRLHGDEVAKRTARDMEYEGTMG